MSEMTPEYRWPCPCCGERIPWEAKECRFCKAIITSLDTEAHLKATGQINKCNVCNKMFREQDVREVSTGWVCCHCVAKMVSEADPPRPNGNINSALFIVLVIIGVFASLFGSPGTFSAVVGWGLIGLFLYAIVKAAK